MSRQRFERFARIPVRQAGVCLISAVATLLFVVAAASGAPAEEQRTLQASAIFREMYDSGSVIRKLEDGTVTVHVDGSLRGTGTFRYRYHHYKPNKIEEGSAPVKLTGTLKNNRVSLTCPGIHTDIGFTSGFTLVGQLVDGKFHGVTHKGKDHDFTVTLEMTGATLEDDDQEETDTADTTADDEPLEPIPDAGDGDKPSEEFCRHCTAVERTLDALEREATQVSAQLAALHAELAGLQAEVGAWKNTLKNANSELIKAKAAESETLFNFWQGQVDKANIALKQSLAKIEAKQAEIDKVKKTWSKTDQQRLDSYREQWAKIRDQCAKCKQ